MKAGIKVLASGGGFTNPSVMLWTPHNDKKYSFNVGNGIHRQTMTSSTHIYDSNTVFLTHIDPSTMADFPNYLLRNRNDFAIVGPINTTQAIMAHRYYIGRRSKSIHVTECTEDIALSDGYLTVYPVVLSPSSNNNNISSNNDNNNIEKKRTTYPMMHIEFKKPMTDNSQFKASLSMEMKSFYDWTVLRGGLLHFGSGHPTITTEEIEKYMIYKMMKISDGLTGDHKEYRPENYKQIKEYIRDPFKFTENVEGSEEFWALESRHFRIITRMSNIVKVNQDVRKTIVRERGKVYTSHKHYGPVRSQSQAFLPVNRDSTTNMGPVVCYVCHLPDIIGKFDNKKADQLGVVGRLRSQLCKGESVVNAEGKTIHPDDVLSPSTIGPVVMVLACPSLHYLKDLVNNPMLKKYASSHHSGCIVHMVPESLVETEEYTAFIKLFSSDQWQHLVMNEASAYHELTVKSAQMTNGLHKVSPLYFPERFPYYPALPLPAQLSSQSNVHRARYLQTVCLNPLVSNKYPSIDNSKCIEDIDLDFSFETQTPPISTPVDLTPFEKSTEEMLHSLSDEDLEIVFFGTCCSQASEFRDESCIFLDMFDKGSIIFDVGGGSYSQMFRKYGKELLQKKLAKLKLIYLSHLHTDHHQGLFKLIEMRHRALEDLGVPENERTLCILTPPNGIYYMTDIESSLTLGKDLWKYLEFYDSNNFDNSENQRMLRFLGEKMGLETIQTVPVVHNFAATGIVIKSVKGWSIGYSGDTAFCDRLASLPVCKDLTVLIHEATFQDHQSDLAKKKSHSTFSDAVKTAKMNNAYMTILTHFSQRYPSLDTLVSNADDNTRVALSFDFLTVNLKNLKGLPKALSCLKIDPNDDEQMEVGFE